MIVFDPPKFSVRLKDVLADFGLAYRRVSEDCDPMHIAAEPINWDSVRTKRKNSPARPRLSLTVFSEFPRGLMYD